MRSLKETLLAALAQARVALLTWHANDNGTGLHSKLNRRNPAATPQ